MKLSKCIAWIVGVNVLEMVLIGALWLGVGWNARLALARKLDLQGGPAGLESYVVQHLVAGMSRQDVITLSGTIGQFSVTPYYRGEDYCETLAFYEGPFNTRSGEPWSLCYDNSNMLISVTSAGRQ